MPRNTNAQPPARWVKVVASLFVAWHFYGIFTAVTATSTSALHPAPLPAVQMSRTNYWYTQALFLHNAYRFYVPDPGPVQTMWFRLEYEGPKGRPVAYWYELPRRSDFFFRMAYQRHVSVTMLLQMQGTDPTKPDQLHPIAETLQSSYVRSVAHKFPHHPNLADIGPLKKIDVYHVGRVSYPSGYHIQRGFTLDDPRWYRPVFYASYAPDGTKLELEPPKKLLREELPKWQQVFFAQPEEQMYYSELFPVTAEFLLYDYHSLLELGYSSQDALKILNPPGPMQRLLRHVPEALDLSPVISLRVYRELITLMHQSMKVRRPVRPLEEDLPPLGFRPTPTKPTAPAGLEKPTQLPPPARPPVGS